MRSRLYGPDFCPSSAFPTHNSEGHTTALPTDDHIHDARALRYHRANSPIVITQLMSEATRVHNISSMSPPPGPRPRSSNARLSHNIVPFITSCGQHTQVMDLAQRIRDWERQCSPDNTRFTLGRRLPWRTPPPIWAPAKMPIWSQDELTPSPLSSPPSSPSPSPSPPLLQPLWSRLHTRPQTPNEPFRDTDTCLSSRSPPPNSPQASATPLQFVRKKPERDELRHHSPGSYLTTQIREEHIARNLAEADALRDKREAREMRAKREALLRSVDTSDIVIESIEVPPYKPPTIFNEDFNFGPKTRNDHHDYIPRLSPRSSRSSPSDFDSEVEKKSVKRQRHDSSNAKAAAKSRRDRLHSSSSLILVERDQPGPSVPKPLRESYGMLFAHPGRLADDARHEPAVVCSPSYDVRHMASDYNPRDIAEGFEARKQLHPRDSKEVFECEPMAISWGGCKALFKRRQEAALARKRALEDDYESAQRVLREQIRMRTCYLQRRPRTTRDHAPVYTCPSVKTATSEYSSSTGTPPLSPLVKSSENPRPASTRPPPTVRGVRRRSPLPKLSKCRSSDTFLRNVKGSLETRQIRELKEEAAKLRWTEKGGYRGIKREDTPDPRNTGRLGGGALFS